jgi:hypothetical protein
VPAQAAGKLSGRSVKAAKPGRAAAKRATKKPTRAAAAAEPVPAQGFESEGERTSGPVHPPGGAELVSSAAEIVGELARAGLGAGERLLKDVLARLPLS